MIKRSIHMSFALVGIVVVATMALAAVGASSASALSPWWHLNVDSAPAVLQSGYAEDDVQELTVSATGGQFALFEPEAYERGELVNGKGEQEFALFEFNAEASVVQEGLEGIYGSGNVTVTGGPGDEEGTKPYTIRFLGQRVPLIEAVSLLNCTGAVGGGCKEKVTVNEVSAGRSDGRLVIVAANLGDADLSGGGTPINIADKLPNGVRAVAIKGYVQGRGERNLIECSLASLSCSLTKTIAPYEDVRIYVSVDLKQGARADEVNEVTADGGNARPATFRRPISFGTQSASFGVESYEMTPEMEGGVVDTQAGSHPFQLTTTLGLNRGYDESSCVGHSCEFLSTAPELAKDLNFKLPPGLIGNPTPFPQCTPAEFLRIVAFTNECQPDTVVGVANVKVVLASLVGEAEEDVTAPLFNLVPSVGEPARFAFLVLGVPVYLDTSVRTGGDYGVTVKVSNITQTATFLESRVTFWGVPGDPRHDEARGWSCIGDGYAKVGPCSATVPHRPPPFLELPTSCTGPLQTTVETDSWLKKGSFAAFGPATPLPSLDGCNALPFSPSIQVTPDGQAGSTPTGLAVAVHVPQEVSLVAEGLGEADVKNTTVALPAGIGLNPAAADGLQSCSESQVSLSTPGGSSCPESSKVGLVKIKTPLLPNQLEGAAYLAAQDANPFGSLVALYVVAQDPVSGTIVKLAGEVVPDPVTGQLVSTFKNTPQLPFETFELHFFGGDRAPLSTPNLCGAYTTNASIEPWTQTNGVDSNSTFNVISGPNGTPCASPLPFSPSLTAGTTSIQAGGFSPFTMTMSRPDGSQNLQAIKLTMPPGLLGTLSTVKLCKEPQADEGTCGPESLIGHTTVSVGVGGDPYTVTGGEVFITEGYEGAPYGLSIVNPASRWPVQPWQGDRQGEDRSGPLDGGVDDHDGQHRSVQDPHDLGRDPIADPACERDRGQEELHVQPHELQSSAGWWESLQQ